jgi:hypothetical protein
MSENTDSFFFLDDEKTYQIFDPLQNEFNTKCEDYSFNKFTKPDIFKITNYKFLKKKREESIMKTKKKRQWTTEEVNNFFKYYLGSQAYLFSLNLQTIFMGTIIFFLFPTNPYSMHE